MIRAFSEYAGLEAGFCNAAESLSLADPVLMTQVHSADVLVVDQRPTIAPECDALVSRQTGLRLTVKTADCAPVLFFDPVARVIGAAHAGWKGALQGIMENTVLTMLKMGSHLADIQVAVGPHLTQQSFQVSDEMRALFPRTEHLFFKQSETGLYFDFSGYLRHRLERIGLTQIQISSLDTFSDLTYNSYRRDRDNPARQYSFIMLTKGEEHV